MIHGSAAIVRRLQKECESLSDSRLESMQHGALICVTALHALASKGLNTVTAILGNQAELMQWQHYPDSNDVFDRNSGSQYFFHCHSADARPVGEHGHFHLFGHAGYQSSETRPREQRYSHLLGISVNAQGLPTRLFTTNRWVTDEQWLPGPQVLALIEAFCINKRQPSPALHQWLHGMLLLFRPQIERVIAQRDNWYTQATSKRPVEKVMEDRRTHIISIANIAFFEQIQAIDALE